MRTETSLPVTEKNVASQYDPSTKLGNWDKDRTTIDRIVIHTMVGYAQGADERFNDPTSNVSAHYGVLENGEIWHWVDEDKVAYHAGNYAMNQRSIGIEAEDSSQPNSPRPDILYTIEAMLVREICQDYNIPIDRQHILKHSEVSDNPTSCPDSLDIDRIVALAANPQPDPLTQCRNDRDLNWNCYVLLLQALDLTPDPNNKIPQADVAVNMIKDLQVKAAEPKLPAITVQPTITQPTETESNSSPSSAPSLTPDNKNIIKQFLDSLVNWFS